MNRLTTTSRNVKHEHGRKDRFLYVDTALTFNTHFWLKMPPPPKKIRQIPGQQKLIFNISTSASEDASVVGGKPIIDLYCDPSKINKCTTGGASIVMLHETIHDARKYIWLCHQNYLHAIFYSDKS